MKKENLPPVGTKVWDAVKYPGIEGLVAKNDNGNSYPIIVSFNDIKLAYTLEGGLFQKSVPTLSLTPYDLVNGGFTPISEWNKPKIGDVGYFWDNEKYKQISYSVLCEIYEGGDFPYESLTGVAFKNFSPEIPEWYKAKTKEIRKWLKK